MKKNLTRVLKKYNLLQDIIVFGSSVKGRSTPHDLDLALIVKERDLSLVSEIKKELQMEKVHLELILNEDIYFSTLFLSLLNEGYSIKKNNYLRDILGTKPMRMYAYELQHLNHSEKTLFGQALKKTLPKIKGERVGVGVILIPLEQASYFEDFMQAWGLKYKTKEWTVW